MFSTRHLHSSLMNWSQPIKHRESRRMDSAIARKRRRGPCEIQKQDPALSGHMSKREERGYLGGYSDMPKTPIKEGQVKWTRFFRLFEREHRNFISIGVQ